jgi:hypothetical protein
LRRSRQSKKGRDPGKRMLAVWFQAFRCRRGKVKQVLTHKNRKWCNSIPLRGRARVHSR